MRTVLITGVGVVSPIGNELSSFWQSLLDGRSGVRRITRFDPSPYACQVAGEVCDTSYQNELEPRKLRTTTHVAQMALGATNAAMRDARLRGNEYSPDLIGVSVGTALGGWREGEQQHAIFLERGARRVNPFIANGAPNHTPAAEIATLMTAQGAQVTFTSGCTSSLQAIGYGASLIASGELQMCVAGGFESPLCHLVFAGMSRTQELSTLNEDPPRASRPFDREHAGMVLSEGSCMLILESEESAFRRGVAAYAQIRGFGSSCDAQGLFGFDALGKPGALAIHRLLTRCAVEAADIDYVCAHANSSPAFDRKETLVVKAAFGECAARLPISSIKAILGHPFGASGAFQVAATSLAIRSQTIPPTHHLQVPDQQCDLDYVPTNARPVHIRNALVTSYGYGGVNAFLLIAAPGD